MVTRQEIVGTWLMVDRGTDDPADEAASLARYGPEPRGLLIISDEGWMNAAISWRDRPGLTGNGYENHRNVRGRHTCKKRVALQ